MGLYILNESDRRILCVHVLIYTRHDPKISLACIGAQYILCSLESKNVISEITTENGIKRVQTSWS